ncbi:MAG: prolipoprotein diacylglyceryl transferase [Gilvibacter sp.]
MHYLGFVWNPLEGIDLGFFEIKFYSLSYIVAFILGWYIIKRFFKNENEPIEKLDSLFIYMVLAILIGARLGHVFFYERELLTSDPLSVILPFRTTPEFAFTGFRGLASHGATIGVLIALYLYNKKYLKKSLLWILDRMVVPTAVGAAFVRIGNWMNSEIVGKETEEYGMAVQLVRDHYSHTQAVRKTGLDNINDAYAAIVNSPELLAAVPFRHPTQLYEAFGYLVTFVILWFVYWKTDKKKQLGYLLGLFFVLLWTIRFFVEFLKDSQGEEYLTAFGLNTGQLLSIPFIILGLYLMFRPSKTTA